MLFSLQMEDPHYIKIKHNLGKLKFLRKCIFLFCILAVGFTNCYLLSGFILGRYSPIPCLHTYKET